MTTQRKRYGLADRVTFATPQESEAAHAARWLAANSEALREPVTDDTLADTVEQALAPLFGGKADRTVPDCDYVAVRDEYLSDLMADGIAHGHGIGRVEHFKYDTNGGWSFITGAWSITGRDERETKRAERPWTDIRTLGASTPVYWSGLDSDERLTPRPWAGAGIVLDAITRERIGSLLVPNSTDGLKGAKVSPSARGQGVTSRDDAYLALSPKQRAAQRKREQRARQRAAIDTTAERGIVKRNLAGTTAHGE